MAFDARPVTAIEVGVGVEETGFALYDIAFTARPGIFQASQNGGEVRTMPNQTRIGTSLTREQLQTYGAALVVECGPS